MARSERSNTAGVHQGSDFPSSPVRPPRFGLYVTRADGRFTYQAFCSTRAAQYFLDIVTEGQPYTWRDNCTILTEHGTHISTRGHHATDISLEAIIEARRDPSWEPPEPYGSEWRRFVEGEAPRERTTPRPKPSAPERAAAAAQATPRASRPPTREPRTPRDTGAVTVGALAAQMNIDPRHARAALRASGEVKPAAGWEWPPEQVERIKRIIKEHLK